MAAAAGPGGAEMGQSSKASQAAQAGSTAVTEGSWSPSFGVKGLDVSYYQSGVNWQTQWNLGARFAYVKATEGNYYTNPSFAAQYKGARQVGMIRGAYHFANPLASSGADQARSFVQGGGGWSADGYTLPPVLDIETNPYAGQTIDGFYQGNACYDRSPSQLASWVRDFGNTMKSLTGRLPMIYTNTSWWKQCTADAAGFGAYPLWTANWPSSATNYAGPLPASWNSYSVWQYSESGPFAGDSNVWNGDYEGLQRFAGASLNTPVDDFNGDGLNDLLSIRADGALWFYPGNGRGGFASPLRIGTGWNIYSRIIGVGDFNSDRKNDFVARRPDGSLWFYAGTGTVGSGSQGYAPAVKIGNSDWGSFSQLTGVRDFNGDGKSDLVAAHKDGSLWFFAGTGTVSATQSGYAAGRKIGSSGWNVYTKLVGVRNFGGKPSNDLVATKADGTLWFYDGTGTVSATSEGYAAGTRIGASGWNNMLDVMGTGDLNGDGKPDLLTQRRDNSLLLYAGTGMNEAGYKPAVNIGKSSWNNFTTVESVQDFDGDGRPDLLAVAKSGALWFYASTGGNGYATGRQIGSGWQIYTKLVGTGDINGDRKSDLLAVRPDGSLWFYAGTGDVSAGNEGYSPARKVGSGWNVYSKLVATRDFDGDGRNDLAGIRPDGSLWFYHGTGRVSANDEGYEPAVKIGRSGWASFHSVAGVEDLDGDGINDLAGIRPDGTLWFYAGTGKVSSARPGYNAGARIGNTEWDAYSVLLGAGDLNDDRQSDLAAVNQNGTFWFYAGAPKRNNGYQPATLVGSLP
ncbi:GH25 family lysozyme [Arthrobacter sp. C9C5]|uniref:GH25 family lysozyme n=1 Tax=Arthrobacter sp. C9C5 TaxID=2735267 RepID=UPI00201C7DF5|nr:GH25 family lysozyme [Arthrobacter sp. C9C5]